MEEFLKNENTFDVFMNEIRIENEMLVEPKKIVSLQTKESRNEWFKKINCSKNILEGK